MGQKEEFMEGEGTAWLTRNLKKIPIENDLVLSAFDGLVGGLSKESSILEVGCSNGWRLELMREKYGCTELYGLDPSEEAIKEASDKDINAVRGTAAFLPFKRYFDVVIYGFCLYLCDREDLFKIAEEGDRVLIDGGLMAIYDFNPTWPHKNAYHHKDGLWSYKQDYDQMFLWNPSYTKLTTTYSIDNQTKASLLRKNMGRGWPCGSESWD